MSAAEAEIRSWKPKFDLNLQPEVGPRGDGDDDGHPACPRIVKDHVEAPLRLGTSKQYLSNILDIKYNLQYWNETLNTSGLVDVWKWSELQEAPKYFIFRVDMEMKDESTR